MIFKVVFIFLLFNFLSAEDESENPFRESNFRIVNGEPFYIEDAPYFALMIRELRPWCGASIISQKWILGAAHCIKDKLPASGYAFRTGSSRRSIYGVVTNVTKVVAYPTYSDIKNPVDDFALFLLAKSLTYNSYTKAIKLPESNFVINEGAEVLAVGYGNTKNVTQSKEILRGVKLTIISSEKCETLHKQSTMTDSMVCTSTETEQDTCQGDSGGPLEYIYDGLLVGLTSFGVGCAVPGNPGVYAKVAFARDWIKMVSGV